MNTRMISAAVVMSVVAMFGSGCSAPAAQPAHTAQAPAKWQTAVLADGVEIRVSDEAGPDATMVVEQIQREMRGRYISAPIGRRVHPTSRRAWSTTRRYTPSSSARASAGSFGW